MAPSSLTVQVRLRRLGLVTAGLAVLRSLARVIGAERAVAMANRLLRLLRPEISIDGRRRWLKVPDWEPPEIEVIGCERDDEERAGHG